METAQPLHPESKALLDFLVTLNVQPPQELEGMEEARARWNGMLTHVEVAGVVNYDGSRKELFVPQPDFTGTSNTITGMNLW